MLNVCGGAWHKKRCPAAPFIYDVRLHLYNSHSTVERKEAFLPDE